MKRKLLIAYLFLQSFVIFLNIYLLRGEWQSAINQPRIDVWAKVSAIKSTKYWNKKSNDSSEIKDFTLLYFYNKNTVKVVAQYLGDKKVGDSILLTINPKDPTKYSPAEVSDKIELLFWVAPTIGIASFIGALALVFYPKF
jgi:hypothetical protein